MTLAAPVWRQATARVAQQLKPWACECNCQIQRTYRRSNRGKWLPAKQGSSNRLTDALVRVAWNQKEAASKAARTGPNAHLPDRWHPKEHRIRPPAVSA